MRVCGGMEGIGEEGAGREAFKANRERKRESEGERYPRFLVP